MKLLKILFGLIGSVLSLFPITLFMFLFFKGNIQWLLMIRNLPEWALYLFGLSIIFSCVFLLIQSFGYIKRNFKTKIRT